MNIGVLLAAGTGSRAETDIPKQFTILNGKYMLHRSLRCLIEEPDLGRIYIAVPQKWLDYSQIVLSELPATARTRKMIRLVIGGDTRSESIRLASQAAINDQCIDSQSLMVVHDADRPFATVGMVRNSLTAASELVSSVCVVPEHDTVFIHKDDDNVCHMADRSLIYRGQAPEGVNVHLWNQCYDSMDETERYRMTGTVQVVLAKGHKVVSVPGDDSNIKITTPWDFTIAEAYLRRVERSK